MQRGPGLSHLGQTGVLIKLTAVVNLEVGSSDDVYLVPVAREEIVQDGQELKRRFGRRSITPARLRSGSGFVISR